MVINRSRKHRSSIIEWQWQQLLINKKRFLDIAETNSIDVLIAATPVNVAYCTEFLSTFMDTQAYALVPVSSSPKATIIVPTSEADQVVDASPDIEQVYPYGTFYYEAEEGLVKRDRRLQEIASRKPFSSHIDALAAAIREQGFGESRIGLDEGAFTADIFNQLGRLFPHADLVHSSSMFADIRKIKTEEEINRLRQAATITENALMNALNLAAKNITEREIAANFERGLIDGGARPDFTVVAFADRTAMPNAQPTEKKLKAGDWIRFDIGCAYRYYHSDIARIAVLGCPSSKLVRNYEAILKGEEKGLEIIRPGIRVSEIFEEIMKTVRREGIRDYKRHHCGHGIGIASYDPPLISPGNETILESGMVLCVETPYYQLGWGGVQVEDTIVVRDNGIEMLTSTDRSLHIC
jgi:Xaa-Pro aminopeptidase